MGDRTKKVRSIALAERKIGEGESVFIIAEIGVNHEGSVQVCARMIEEAAKAGADAIKLQTMDADENYVVGSESYALFKNSALSREETASMFELSRSLGVEVFTTSGDPDTLEWVEALHPVAHKISSGLMTNERIVRQAAGYGRPLLISTGVGEVEEIDNVVATVRSAGRAEFALFQCTSLYPVPIDDVNLRTIAWLSDRFDAPVGFSDHTCDDEAAVLSVGAGATMLEKHFTTTPERSGFDHGISLEPGAFATMVAKIRRAEQLMGQAEKSLPEKLLPVRDRLLRCLVARQSIAAGERFTLENLGLKRPTPERRGLDPKYFERVLGNTCLQDLAVDDPVTDDIVGDWHGV